MVQTFEIGSDMAIAIIPDGLQSPYRSVWLIASKGESAREWLEKTAAGKYAESAKAMILCLPGGKDDGFYAYDAWESINTNLPDADMSREAIRLIGLGEGAVTVLNLAFKYPDRFFTAVAVSPDYSSDAEIISNAEKYIEMNSSVPHLVICDCKDGKGGALGDAINRLGYGMHVHDNRMHLGWALADEEISNCLAHL